MRSAAFGGSAVSLLRRALLCVVVTLVAAFFRLHALDTIPPGLYVDEATNGLDASAIQRGERWPLYIEAEVKWQSQEALYHYMMAGVFRLFGTTVTAIRLTSAVVGIATVFGFSILCGTLCGWRVGFLAASLLAVCRWHVTFSRIGFRGILVPLWIVLVLVAMYALCTRRTPGTAVVFGAMLALGFQTYPAYWIVPVPCLVVLGILLWARDAEHAPVPPGDGRGRAAAKPLTLAAWCGAAFLAAASPLIGYAMAKPEYYFARAASIATPAQAPANRATLLLDNFQKSLFMLHLRGDANPRHNIPGRPLLDPITGLGFLAGLGVVVTTLGTDTPLTVGLLLFWLLLLLPAAVSGDAPHALRAIGAIPAVCLISALGLARAADLLSRGRVAVSWAIGLALVAGAAALNYQAYFREWARRPDVAAAFSADVGRLFGHVADLAETNDLYACPYVYDAPQIRFLNLQRRAPLHRLEDATAFVATAGQARDRVLACELPAVNAFIEALYPRAELVGRYAAASGHMGQVYRVPRTQLRSSLTDDQRAAVADILGEGPRAREAESGCP
jgi:hypothetical protein